MARHRKIDLASGLTRDALETLLDLVEIRLSHVEIYDREDAREVRQLEQTRDQLTGMLGLPELPSHLAARQIPEQVRAYA
jgi:hypothetical protein